MITIEIFIIFYNAYLVNLFFICHNITRNTPVFLMIYFIKIRLEGPTRTPLEIDIAIIKLINIPNDVIVIQITGVNSLSRHKTDIKSIRSVTKTLIYIRNRHNTLLNTSRRNNPSQRALIYQCIVLPVVICIQRVNYKRGPLGPLTDALWQ
jgi:hypothetical protein